MRTLSQGLTLAFALAALSAPVVAADTVSVVLDAGKPGATIDRHVFGQFAEHLGHGIYEGVWVGPDSPIPNTRGIRNDVVAALRAIKVPVVRWPGGCFADEYHWRNGIGAPGKRRAVLFVPRRIFGTGRFASESRAFARFQGGHHGYVQSRALRACFGIGTCEFAPVVRGAGA